MTTFSRETYLAKVSQVGAPMGKQGLFFRRYNNHNKKRANKMGINDNPDSSLARPKPFSNHRRITADEVEENVWDAQNPDRRGFKQGKEFRGERPLRFHPSQQFNPAIVGGAASKRSGWFQGGTSQKFTGPQAHIEDMYHNHESGAWMGNQNKDPSLKDTALHKKTIDPFGIKIPASLSLKHARYQYA